MIAIHDMPRDTSKQIAEVFVAACARGLPIQALKNYVHWIKVACQSEIERIMLDGLMFCPFGYYDDLNHVLSYDELERGGIRFYGDNAIIVPQAKIARTNYRADFLVILNARGRGVNPLVVIECDGHDYHERTKEQAARDRKRDRDIQRLGIPVLRFTGSEIVRDIDECIAQIDLFGAGLLERVWRQ